MNRFSTIVLLGALLGVSSTGVSATSDTADKKNLTVQLKTENGVSQLQDGVIGLFPFKGNTPIQTQTIEDGKVDFKNLESTVYRVEMVQAPSGYPKELSTKHVVMNKDQQIEMKAYQTDVAVAVTGIQEAGSGFDYELEFRGSEYEIVAKGALSENRVLHFENLKPGHYALILNPQKGQPVVGKNIHTFEVKHESYQAMLQTEAFDVSDIEYRDYNYELDHEDDKLMPVMLVNVDEYLETVQARSVYEISDAFTGQVIRRIIIDKTRTTGFDPLHEYKGAFFNLSPGKYTIQQVAIGEGYVLNQQGMTLNVNAYGPSFVQFENQTQS